MARYKPGTKEETHKRIVDEASRQFRAKGIEATSIADVMGALDLTVGGFYKHFSSKAALLNEAMGGALAQSARRLSRATPAEGETDRRAALARMYLTQEHRMNIASGCPIAALGNDISRADDATRKGFEEQLLAYMDTVADGD
ncbi:MAG: TetR family transcriptional regulator, partial [Candidatus Hydrogenedentota bacterium]